MSKIMIDGVDVAECSLLNTKTKVCLFSRETCNAICDYGCYARNEIIDRLKQENETLRRAIKDINIVKVVEQNEQYKQALEEIREIAKEEYTANSHKFFKIEELINEVLK